MEPESVRGPPWRRGRLACGLNERDDKFEIGGARLCERMGFRGEGGGMEGGHRARGEGYKIFLHLACALGVHSRLTRYNRERERERERERDNFARRDPVALDGRVSRDLSREVGRKIRDEPKTRAR
jgi:hypothetical protein